MNQQVGAVIRAGMALKLGQVKQAASSYVRDRTDEGKSIAIRYAIGAGLYAAAGIFLIAAIIVGTGALFYWLETNYGKYIAFAIVGGVLVFFAMLCAVSAAIKLKPKKTHYPSLASRMRVAVTANPLTGPAAAKAAAAATLASSMTDRSHANRSHAKRNAVESARETAADVLRSAGSPAARLRQASPSSAKAGAALAVTLIGWALARRYNQQGRTKA